MKLHIAIMIGVASCLLVSTPGHARDPYQGYYRKDGSYVAPRSFRVPESNVFYTPQPNPYAKRWQPPRDKPNYGFRPYRPKMPRSVYNSDED